MQNRRIKKPCSLLQICLRYVAKNMDQWTKHQPENSLECLPPNLKNALLERSAKLKGLHDDDQLKTLLNSYTLKLYLSSSTVTDITLKNIALQCPNLRCIRLTGGKFKFTTQQLLVTFPLLRNLREISLQNSDQMTDLVIQCIAKNCSGLTVLDVGKNSKLTDQCIEYIADLKLTHLNLSHSQITDDGLTKLSASEHLVDLNISYCKISSQGLAGMSWDRIQYIGFDGCDIEDLDFISNGKQLKYIQWTIT